MTRKQKRLSLIAAAGLILASSAALILYALNDRIVFFYTPSDLTKQVIGPGTRVRIGGLVDVGSVDKSALRSPTVMRNYPLCIKVLYRTSFARGRVWFQKVS